MELGRGSEDLRSVPGPAVNQLFGLDQVFLGLNTSSCKMRGFDYKVNKSSPLFDILVPSPAPPPRTQHGIHHTVHA